jgi:hypothetical protein
MQQCMALTLQYWTRCIAGTFSSSRTVGLGAPYGHVCISEFYKFKSPSVFDSRWNFNTIKRLNLHV